MLFFLLAALTLLPLVTPGAALAAGAVFALALGESPVPWSGRAAALLLKVSVVGLGFGLPLGAVLAAGAAGFGYTAGGIVGTLVLGTLLGRWLRVEGPIAFLITAGTSICGGSAIAAVGPIIGANAYAMAVALATVFLLNGVALYVFPVVGAALDLSQPQFAVWAAVAIHDTSSVVGAAATYGSEALRLATVLKLTRALWIFPLALGTAWWMRRNLGREMRGAPPFPWFIAFFLLAAVVRSLAGTAYVPLLEGVVGAARQLLVLTLFLIGTGLSRAALRSAGWRPLALGGLLWAAVSALTLLWVLRGVSL